MKALVGHVSGDQRRHRQECPCPQLIVWLHMLCSTEYYNLNTLFAEHAHVEDVCCARIVSQRASFETRESSALALASSRDSTKKDPFSIDTRSRQRIPKEFSIKQLSLPRMWSTILVRAFTTVNERNYMLGLGHRRRYASLKLNSTTYYVYIYIQLYTCIVSD